MSGDAWLDVPAPFGVLRLWARNGRLAAVDILAGEPGGRGFDTGPGAPPADDLLLRAANELAAYFAGSTRDFAVPVDLSGLPPFTRQVLEVLRTVPYGETVTYAELAARVGSPRAARAVGRAVAVNPLPIVIPCHRVVAAGGRPGGYSGGGGLATKLWLLAREGCQRWGNSADFQEKALDRGAGIC